MENHKNIAESEELESETNLEPTMEALLQEQVSFQERLKSREIVWVKVIQIQESNILVDIGEKQEGVIAGSEFADRTPPTVGSRVPAILISLGRDNKPATLSYKKAQQQLGWKQAQKAFEEKARVRGTVTSAVKGGFIVDVAGVSAFLPASLADLRPVRKPKILVGTGVRCYILELHADKKQLVLSRKAVLEEEVKKRKDKLLSQLKVGEVRIGRVTHIAAATGAFLDLGGLEGLLATTDVAWREPAKALAAFAAGQKMRVKILRIDTTNGKVALGAKQLTPNPADALKKKFPAKATVSGKIIDIKRPDGIRIELNDKTAAYCSASELPQQEKGGPIWPAVGEKIHGVVLGIRPETFEVTLSIRRYDEVQDRKRVAQYMKAAPKFTLGQILTSEEDQ
jgi:ribosomal protein S1